MTISIPPIPKRIPSAKPGDIYKVPLEGDKKGYFQYMMLDGSNLNSEVIRVFTTKYNNDDIVDAEDVIQEEIAFYTHTTIPAGVKLGLWYKVGNVSLGDFELPYFRNSTDPGAEDPEDSVSWSVWRPNEPWQFVGVLNEQQRKYDTAYIQAPQTIVHRMFCYPEKISWDLG